jgi:3-hydroxymyristoyl/3-hydroxydecanoyl-(acyl carrier protein) dehydratase
MKTLPDIRSRQNTSDGIILELFVSEDVEYFKGHFDTQAILPGVALTDWATRLGIRYFEINGDFIEMKRIKFHEFVTPNSTIELILNYRAEKKELTYRYRAGELNHASGKIIFG